MNKNNSYQNIQTKSMDEQRVEAAEIREVNYKRTDYLIFLISFAIMIVLLLYASRFFWVALPFAATYLVKSLRVM